MPRSVSRRSLFLTLLILLPVPALALLCRGHNPSRLDTPNLPSWERRPPQALPPCRLFRLSPLTSGSIQISDHSQRDALLRADENRLLAGAEQMHRSDAGPAGDWLEKACAWGRADRPLREKQDRVAARLMNTQAEDGFIGARAASALWTVRDTRAQLACLRGLLSYYALTHRPAAIFAAMSAADRLMTEHPSNPALIYPLTRLYQATADTRYLTAARRQAENQSSDGLGLCALYEATGESNYLQSAQQEWAKGKAVPAFSAEMLLLTGRPGYAATLNQAARPTLELLRTAWTRAPQGFALNTSHNCTAIFHGVRLTQQAVSAKSRTITIGTAKPTKFTLQLFVPTSPAAQIRVNGVLQTTPGLPGRYVLLPRRWHNDDRVTVQTKNRPAS